jgi:hypothetical protein
MTLILQAWIKDQPLQLKDYSPSCEPQREDEGKGSFLWNKTETVNDKQRNTEA